MTEPAVGNIQQQILDFMTQPKIMVTDPNQPTLRDWFAMAALISGNFMPKSSEDVAMCAYDIADAMLTERGKHVGGR